MVAPLGDCAGALILGCEGLCAHPHGTLAKSNIIGIIEALSGSWFSTGLHTSAPCCSGENI
jgi:hypothetical protein